MIERIFISHSSIDKDYAECLVRLLTDMKVNDDIIFCSSVKGYGVPLGEDFLEYIKNTLNENSLVLFVLSERFYHSKICLCEMGAAWVKTNKHIPIIVPPFKFKDIEGVIVGKQGLEINVNEDINELKNEIEKILGIAPLNINIWEKRRNEYLKKINELISKEIQQDSRTIIQSNIDYKRLVFKLIRNNNNKGISTHEIYKILNKEYDVDKYGIEILDIYNVLEDLENKEKIRGIRCDGVKYEDIPWRAVI
ncbi:toll/interleukin-1 receptor domain-containing protein [Herbivorax sp. ANBcel31]|uniref:toll/interleukin-1 receptor domain-containing protein n=1 Tax=Herbivorax sp. ANBcel31 TaxID=3069754 RepID=UPI0027B0161D|nr:toll/interleukin-1 receptor domain-containing protein [Herbivorax sp. ANBcel31]MDQ2086986.1 toll/interleukin-1 receptor domain-containing protein [Herbivorax sp. ANBcel31]